MCLCGGLHLPLLERWAVPPAGPDYTPTLGQWRAHAHALAENVRYFDAKATHLEAEVLRLRRALRRCRATLAEREVPSYGAW